MTALLERFVGPVYGWWLSRTALPAALTLLYVFERLGWLTDLGADWAWGVSV